MLNINTLKQTGVLEYPLWMKAAAEGSIVMISGENSSVSTTIEDIGYTSAPNNTYLTGVSGFGGVKLDIQTTAATDTVAGTGAQVVRIHYLDTDWDQAYTDVNTGGISQDSASVSNILRVTSMEVVQVGTGGTNAGNIYLRENANSAQRYCVIPLGEGVSKAGFTYVPRNHMLFLTDVCVHTNQSNAKLAAVYVYAQNLYGDAFRTETSYPVYAHGADAPFGDHISCMTPMVVGEKCRVRFRAIVAVATANLVIGARGMMVCVK